MNPHPHPRSDQIPTRWQVVIFSLKAALFRLRRWVSEFAGKRPRPLPRRSLGNDAVAAESRTPLYTASAPEELGLQAGKVHNLRLAARALHGRVIGAGEVFSFWANVGRATRRRGFVPGRELREGCIVPSLGGGLCQLSNALYDVALQAGAEIVERHAHSRRVSGSAAAVGRDATVFWNYVDLRFRAPVEMQLAVELTADQLCVRLHTRAPLPATTRVTPASVEDSEPVLVESCETCGVVSCFRHPAVLTLPHAAGVAWMVDAFHPEHDAWMAAQRGPSDWLLLPLDSQRLHLGPYRWMSHGFARVRHAPWTTLRRSWHSRRLAAQGAERQRALLRMDEEMARSLARRLPPLAAHLVVSQNLLPFLWRDGVLGGRTFDVLMTRLPLRELEATLDVAAQQYPESSTLADFRAPADLVEAESGALAAAQRWITPHRAIAALAGPRACLLDWHLPAARPRPRGEVIVFPASTLARKGAYELREAARELQLSLRPVGPVIEHADFWCGVPLAPPTVDWLEGVSIAVLPAWVEHQPRRLLQALAAGVPVIASEACGLRGVPGVVTVPAGDVDVLCEAIVAALDGASLQAIER